MALEHTVRGEFGGRHPLRKRPTRQTLVGNYAANCFCRRGAAPRCAGSGRMKLGKLGLPRPKAPNGAGIHPAWRLPTPGCELKTRYPVRKPPTRQTLAENFAAECPPPTWGGAPLRGVAVGDWRTRPAQTLGESPNSRAAPNCEFRARHPLRKTPPGQNQAGSHALNCSPPAWWGALSRRVEQVSEPSLSRCRRVLFRIARWHPLQSAF